ncbi:cation:proton antiporter [Microbacterium sediminis]|uniref:cation:proton antiporter n=1 Tax=Microbacterium sediminis TaxID=904291 RepID=UPI0010728790|nr:sodium:proton antiporter [Microbacterium sediminis]QBR75082.1 sodium:proton antiporter [Microbacterium sediminis]
MGVELFYVLVGSVAVAAFARWRGWPAPLLVTAVALVVSLLPFVPEVEIDGHLLLNLTLPPLLYSAALDSSFLSFKYSLPHIRRLGIGLVLVTAVAVGLVAWWIMPELGLAGALLLGAIVGPPDAVSAASIGRKLGLPRRVMNVMSGESLINDATSLTLVRVFAAIVAGATVTVWQGIWEFVLAVGLGVGIGLVFGIVLHQLRMRFDDATVTGTFGLLMPFGAYAIAEHLHGSGVLAVVAMGFYVGYHAPRTAYTTRQQDTPLWHSVDFLLESFVFAYVGLQLPTVIAELSSTSGSRTILIAIAVLLVVIVVRPIFVFASYAWGQLWQRMRLMRFKHAAEEYRANPDSPRARAIRRRKERALARLGGATPTREALRRRVVEPVLSRRERVVISWAGMRGVVTLAMAAALPDLTEHRMVDGHVEVLVAVAFVVTVGTLLLQGLTLTPLIRGLGVTAEAERRSDEAEVARMRKLSRDAGLEYLREQQQQWIDRHGEDSVEGFKRFARAMVRVERGADNADRDLEAAQKAGAVGYDDLVELSKGWLAVRRRVLLDECRAGNLSEEVMRELFVAMDAEELALDTRSFLRGE